MDEVLRAMATIDRGLIFANLVDFDTQYGHRNDVAGYAANLERFDARLGELLPRLRDDDLLVVTADHGNDPTTPSTDHAREYVPLLVTGRRVRPARTSARGRRSPTSVRRSPSCSASAAGARHELPAEISMSCTAEMRGRRSRSPSRE